MVKSDNPLSISKNGIEKGRLLFARDVTFMLSAVSLDTLPLSSTSRNMLCR